MRVFSYVSPTTPVDGYHAGATWDLPRRSPAWGFLPYRFIVDLIARKKMFNPLRAKFFKGNINIYLHFMSFLHIDTMQVVEILPKKRQEPTYST